MASRAKRQRATEPTDGGASDMECDLGAPAGAAERKRELERNRRNLVNVRFAELEAQLARLPSAPARVYRRIDKEVVLKDAAQALASQQRELELATARVASMRAEIDTLRSEKLELRHDKAYLHKEVASARSENSALAADNLKLWQALRKSGALKTTLATDFAKVPLDVVLGVSVDGVSAELGGLQQVNSMPLGEPLAPDGTETGFTDPLGITAQSVGGVPFTSGSTASASTDGFFASAADDLLKGVGCSSVPRAMSNATVMQLELDMSIDHGLTVANQIGQDNDEAHPDVAPCG